MATAQEMERVTALLKEGKVQEAAVLQDTLTKATATAEAEAAGKPLEPPPPREPTLILRDILGQIAHDLGNRPALEALLHEYDEAAPKLDLLKPEMPATPAPQDVAPSRPDPTESDYRFGV
jgi:hypothetical protein